jgi:glyoxylase-like metal-dependent hydrolase (beta-lactamase superfamily II)
MRPAAIGGNMKVGELEILPVFDAKAAVQPTAAYSYEGGTGKGTNADDWSAHTDLLDDEGRLEIHMGGFLVRSGDRRILVDAGMGPDPMLGGDKGGALLESLAALGLSADDVTDVVLTHLHFDHVGWVSRDDAPVFTNATYRCHQHDWDHFVGTDDVATAKMTPVRERFEPFSSDTTLAPGVDTRLCAGHTPGSTIIVLSSGAARAMLIGDVVHCPVELLDDEWAGLADVDRVAAQRARNALAAELEGTDVPVAAAHFPGLQFGRLLAGEGKRGWTFG